MRRSTRKDNLLLRMIRQARKQAEAEITGNAHSGSSMYASGLASEGYAGGYRDALSDVELLIGGTMPYRRDYWPEDPNAG